MKQLKHFSHEHPLIAIGVHAEAEVVCYGCQKPIETEFSVYYSCSTISTSITSNCSTSSTSSSATSTTSNSISTSANSTSNIEGDCGNFFLHKICAELPKTIEHPLHEKHRLTLHSHPQTEDGLCDCKVCWATGWKWFTYECICCDFYVCLRCALEELVFQHRCTEERNFHHEGHKQGTLTLLRKPALFHCDACDTKAEDLSYVCNTCLFWVHNSCASSPDTVECKSHAEHRLILAYSIPEEFRKFKTYCEICNKVMHQKRWLYHCANCRYFVHLKCATSTQTRESPWTRFRKPEVDKVDGDQIDPPLDDLVHFPMPDEPSLDAILQQFVKTMSLTDDTKVAADRINHWAHKDHALILIDELKEELCDGCVLPLSTYPFYGCMQCNFFLHRYCAELPQELQHPLHTHKLNLPEFLEPYIWHTCKFCAKISNGIFYHCGTCDFFIDIVCASLPRRIKHEAHKHALNQITITPLTITRCNGSGYDLSKFAYGCQTCGFYLCKEFATMPGTVRHRWDPHPLHLMYPPIKDHPHEFDCEMCSKDIDPNYWIYHCRDCDLSFHMACLGRNDPCANIKFGATVKIIVHPHSLKLVRNKNKRACSDCRGDDIKFGELVLECAPPCKFVRCRTCHSSDLTVLEVIRAACR